MSTQTVTLDQRIVAATRARLAVPVTFLRWDRDRTGADIPVIGVLTEDALVAATTAGLRAEVVPQ